VRSVARAIVPPGWRRRLRGGHDTSANDASAVGGNAFFELVFGRAPDAAERVRLNALVPDGRIGSPADAHRVLLAFDAQSHPTAFLVRATDRNLSRIDLDGFALWIDVDDPSVSAFIRNDYAWESHVTRVLNEALRAGSTFVDVGANVGFHTFLAATTVGPTGAVVAVEPSSENCRLLQLSKAENHADHVSILPFALDRTAGVRYISAHIGTNAGLIPDAREHLLDGRGTPVYASTLDDIAPPRVDVMKIDVEGAEFRVLEGGRKTLERDKPVIVMEFSCEMTQRTSGVDPGDALQAVLDIGYELFVLDREQPREVPYASAAALLAGWSDPFRIEDLLLRPI
jgi:FkbM family methyltransferase